MSGAERLTRRAVPCGLLGMVVLVAAIERFEVRDNLDFMDNVAASWRYSGKAVKNARGKAILCFGDSMVKFGVLPRVLAEETGEKAYSLALQSGSAPSSYFLLRRALEGGARPRAVVVDFARGILGDGPASVTRPYPWADLLDLREALELCREGRDPDLFASIACRWLLHSDKGRFEIRANIFAALKGGRTRQRDITPALWRNWNINAGGQANPKVGPFEDTVLPASLASREGTWRCDPVNARYVRKFVDLAARRGITVYWLLPPVTPGTQSQWEYSGDERRFLEFVRREQARATNVVVVDGRFSSFERPVFVDGVHLDHDGATALSVALAQVLERHRGTIGRAWVPLPDFADPPARLAVEDVGQSQMLLKSLFSKRRR